MVQHHQNIPVNNWFLEPRYDIAVILPSRKRSVMLESSLLSLLDNAADPSRIQFLLAFDNDDRTSLDYFKDKIGPKLSEAGAGWLAIECPRYGYQKLHQYINNLAEYSSAHWIFFWNDDAQMLSKDWDLRVSEHNGEFKCLRIPTHNAHPYAIFPIVPREWFILFGYLSQHQLSDAWISQISYIVGIMKNIDVDVVHDRHDLTGNNQDETFNERIVFEANPQDPRDFNYTSTRLQRLKDAAKLGWYLKQQGVDTTWFERVMSGEQDPWEVMMSPEFDPNKQIAFVKPTGERTHDRSAV